MEVIRARRQNHLEEIRRESTYPRANPKPSTPPPPCEEGGALRPVGTRLNPRPNACGLVVLSTP